MKTFFLAIAAAAALVACSGKTGIEKELVGAYDAKLVLPDSLLDDAAVKMAAARWISIRTEPSKRRNRWEKTPKRQRENGKSETTACLSGGVKKEYKIVD